MPRERLEAVRPRGWSTGPGRPGALIGLLVLVLCARDARAQRSASDTAPAVAPATSGVSTVFLKEGGTIRGQILDEKGPKGIKIKSQASGATFVVATSQIDSIVRDPGPGVERVTIVPAPAQRMPVTWPAGTVPTEMSFTAVAVPVAPPTRTTKPPAPLATTPAPPRTDTVAPAPKPEVVTTAPVPAPTAPPTVPAPKPVVAAKVTPPAPRPDSVVPPATTAPSRTVDGLSPPLASTVVPPASTAPSGKFVPPASTTPSGNFVPPPNADPTMPVRDSVSTTPDTAAVVSTVAFISGVEYYVGAGRLDGLAEGTEISVYHGDAVVGMLKVKFLASHRASCEAVQGEAAIAVGDTVRFHRPTRAIDQFAAATMPPPNRIRRLSGPGLHGRIGTRYLMATTSTVADGQQVGSNGFNQPSLDARINGLALWGTPLGVALDVRTRQTTSTSLGVTTVDGHTRVYQAVLFWNAPGSGLHAAAGRQYLTTVASVGLFDGALVEFNGAHMSVGALAGFEPDASTLSFSSTVRDFGGYLTYHNRPGTATAMALTVGAIGSYEATATRREWGIAQFTLNNRYLSLYLLQELDYYRPWKLEGPNAEKSAFSGTSQFANASIRATRWLAINGTYDKRRSVPVIRDFTNPETNFDDTYRQGYGVGVQLTGKQVYGGGDWRRSTGVTSGSAQSYTATAGVNRVTRLNVALSARATFYQNDNLTTAGNPAALKTSGQLYSARLGMDPMMRLQLSLNAGLRQEHNPISPDLQKSTWYGVDVDINLARAWFVSFSGLLQKDPANPGTSTLTQFYGGVTWRF